MQSSSLVELESSVQGTAHVVAVRGEIDLSSIDAVRRAVDVALSQRPETVVVDLSRIAFCDSSGIELVVKTHRRAIGQGTRLVVVRPNGPAWRPFELCQIDREVHFVTSSDEVSSGAATPL
ncbi:MAG TPA: STAS domain-containing protein [Thermoleophilaceae bacterium]|nr:STAS domain-containing protein [Thermoleophilaceae bacterium]